MEPKPKPPVPMVESHLPSCPRCRSTDRGPFHNVKVQIVSGTFQGVPFDRVVRKRTTCKNCGQHYAVKFRCYTGEG